MMTSFGFFTMIEAKNTEQKGSNIKCGHFFCLACLPSMESERKQNRSENIRANFGHCFQQFISSNNIDIDIPE